MIHCWLFTLEMGTPKYVLKRHFPVSSDNLRVKILFLSLLIHRLTEEKNDLNLFPIPCTQLK